MSGGWRAFVVTTIALAFVGCIGADRDAGTGEVADPGGRDGGDSVGPPASGGGDSVGTSGRGDDSVLPYAGLLTYAYTCGSDTRVVANFRDPGLVWLFLPERTVSLPRLRSASGARYGDGSTTFWIKGREARLETGETGPTNCTEHRRESFIEDAKLRGNDVWAVGNEPPWMLEIGPDTSVIYIGYDRERHSFPTPEPHVEQEGRRTTWSGETALGPIIVELVGERCSDDMSGEIFEVGVSVTLAGRLLRGCGQALH